MKANPIPTKEIRATKHSTSRFKPPLQCLESHIEKDREPPRHWWWDGDKNDRNQPVFRWTPGVGIPKAKFNVTRLFFEAIRGPIPPKHALINRCGWDACCNPYHWEDVKVRGPSLAVLLPDGTEAFIEIKDLEAAAKARHQRTKEAERARRDLEKLRYSRAKPPKSR